MKRGMFFALACGLAVFCMGCAAEKKSEPGSNVTSGETASTAVEGDFVLVNLKVPNMT